MYQLSPNTSTTLPLNTLFQITLDEQTNTNQQWELVLPPGIELVKSHYSVCETKISTLTRTWDFKADTLGTFTITCHYRKLCCKRTITQSMTYIVVVA